MELEEIYALYFKDVYYFVLSLTRDKHLAEDITSETFLKALKSLDSFKGESDIHVWLFQIAKNTYYSHLRKSKKETGLDSIGEIEAETDIEKIVSSKEEAMAVHKVLHQLSEPYKEVFTLRLFGELSFKQIAELFGKTDNWACVTFYRAKVKIREEMRKNK
ncbi:RNA polymerase sigma-70 factor, ECF subfamily [Alkalibacterium putridalgicola]|uniref:DNA-directed RNA polymerase sigma-70 factor n=1 Tax=Alkalibacterium putridalgicola TaxID=426703 RepID=A0A1H7TVK2_9LACT|nr:sigma-70 family RNA polymerase sigma factor [Alkalibacterium putridalgicola]GEK88601.1 DNA-directed RNA polymerase sigma-70 factor [Alkalibacterium putridalgicola]SEL88585.1 RNA polymerase sigma-70 factor, ECF subfamily [Alkalibacterium putridalgicola]